MLACIPACLAGYSSQRHQVLKTAGVPSSSSSVLGLSPCFCVALTTSCCQQVAHAMYRCQLSPASWLQGVPVSACMRCYVDATCSLMPSQRLYCMYASCVVPQWRNSSLKFPGALRRRQVGEDQDKEAGSGRGGRLDVDYVRLSQVHDCNANKAFPIPPSAPPLPP